MRTHQYDYLFEQDWNEVREKFKLAASYKEKWTSLIPLFEQISAQNAVFIMVWNVVTNRIIYVVDKRGVVGHDISNFLKPNWFEFSLSNVHPKFLQSTALMQQEGNRCFVEESNGNPEKFFMCFDLLYKRSTGEYFNCLQQSLCIEKDEKGNPFLLLSYDQDITYLKKSDTANFIITAPNETKWWNFNFDKNVLEPVPLLSKQEKKILTFLAEGKSSKEIAKELFISPLTVDKHRRNLLSKTNCIDPTGMITYARLVGLI